MWLERSGQHAQIPWLPSSCALKWVDPSFSAHGDVAMPGVKIAMPGVKRRALATKSVTSTNP